MFRRVTRLRQTIERWPNLKREAQAKAHHIFRYARVTVRKIGYNIDAERNVIEMFVFVDPAIAAQFNRNTLHRLTEWGAEHSDIRLDRYTKSQYQLGLIGDQWKRLDFRLVDSWPEEPDFYSDNPSNPLSEEELAELDARRPPAPQPQEQSLMPWRR